MANQAIQKAIRNLFMYAPSFLSAVSKLSRFHPMLYQKAVQVPQVLHLGEQGHKLILPDGVIHSTQSYLSLTHTVVSGARFGSTSTVTENCRCSPSSPARMPQP